MILVDLIQDRSRIDPDWLIAEPVELHFEKFNYQYKELEMKLENLYHFGETGFRIGCLAC